MFIWGTPYLHHSFLSYLNKTTESKYKYLCNHPRGSAIIESCTGPGDYYLTMTSQNHVRRRTHGPTHISSRPTTPPSLEHKQTPAQCRKLLSGMFVRCTWPCRSLTSSANAMFHIQQFAFLLAVLKS